jgi:hypothetical protein
MLEAAMRSRTTLFLALAIGLFIVDIAGFVTLYLNDAISHMGAATTVTAPPAAIGKPVR